MRLLFWRHEKQRLYDAYNIVEETIYDKGRVLSKQEEKDAPNRPERHSNEFTLAHILFLFLGGALHRPQLKQIVDNGLSLAQEEPGGEVVGNVDRGESHCEFEEVQHD